MDNKCKLLTLYPTRSHSLPNLELLSSGAGVTSSSQAPPLVEEEAPFGHT
jgi:hypothetical protein